ncbi:MAG TPA: SRPBCC family protein [Chroococcales cyanobacterium]
MDSTEFVYTTFIKTTQQKVWNALTSAEFTRQYWGCELTSDWKRGSKWHSVGNLDGRKNIAGEVIESSPITKLVYTWHRPDATEEAEKSRVTFDLETVKDVVKLTVTHDKLERGSEMANGISQGWPLVLSSLKSFLETGDPLDIWGIKGGACSTQESKEKVIR